MPHNNPGRTANENSHIAEHPGENVICREQSMWQKEEEEKTALGENQYSNNPKNINKLCLLLSQEQVGVQRRKFKPR